VSTEPIGEHLGRIRAKAEARQERPPPVGDPDVEARMAQVKMVAEARRWQAIEDSWAKLAPAKYRAADPRDFDEASLEAIARWRGLPNQGQPGAWSEGVNLLITGPVGSGKTRAAFAAARGPFEEGAGVGFWPEAELKDALDWRNPDAASTLRGVSLVGVLIIDDLGIDAPNDWWTSKLYAVINRRWLEDLPTIGTTNLGPRELLDAVGPRTYSRLADHPIGVRLTGEDRRRTGRRGDDDAR
jgi:DNA replication protein DnaC